MEKRIEEGPPLFYESCLSPQEWRQAHKFYPNTVRVPEYIRTLDHFAPNEFKCRYRMGGKLTLDEIRIINQRMDELKKLLV